MPATVIRHGPVSVYLGEKSGKYPDGNQVTVRGADTLVAFDTPLVANRLGAELLDADLIVLGHVHEDHMAGLRRMARTPVQAHELDVEAARSWEGLARHYGYAPGVLAGMRAMIEEKFHYVPRPDAQPYGDGACWDLGGGVTRDRVPHAGPHAGALRAARGARRHRLHRRHRLVVLRTVLRRRDLQPRRFPPHARAREGDSGPRLDHVAPQGRDHRARDVPRAAEGLRRAADAREEAIAAFLEQRPSTLAELVAHRFVYPPQLDGLITRTQSAAPSSSTCRRSRSPAARMEERGRWRLCSLRKPA